MKNKLNKLINILFFISFLFLTIYIPLNFTTYNSNWYEYNNRENITQNQTNLAKNASTNLINYFTYQETLNNQFSQTEKLHMKDVRNIYNKLFFIAILSFTIFIIFFKKNKKHLKKFSKINIITILSLILILPFFQYFWTKIFHPILFKNNYWIYYKHEISYLLFPRTFFINSLILIIITSIIINLIIYFKIKEK